jgi:hypothetical protein
VNIPQPKLRSEEFDDDNNNNNNNKLVETNVIKKEAENILKYKELTREIHSMLNVETKAIPVTTGATAPIPTPLRQYLTNRTGKHEIKAGQQKTAILGTAHTYSGKCKTSVMASLHMCCDGTRAGTRFRLSAKRTESI